MLACCDGSCCGVGCQMWPDVARCDAVATLQTTTVTAQQQLLSQHTNNYRHSAPTATVTAHQQLPSQRADSYRHSWQQRWRLEELRRNSWLRAAPGCVVLVGPAGGGGQTRTRVCQGQANARARFIAGDVVFRRASVVVDEHIAMCVRQQLHLRGGNKFKNYTHAALKNSTNNYTHAAPVVGPARGG